MKVALLLQSLAAIVLVWGSSCASDHDEDTLVSLVLDPFEAGSMEMMSVTPPDTESNAFNLVILQDAGSYAGQSHLAVEVDATSLLSSSSPVVELSLEHNIPEPQVLHAHGSTQMSFWMRNVCDYPEDDLAMTTILCPSVSSMTLHLRGLASDGSIEESFYAFPNQALSSWTAGDWQQVTVPLSMFSKTLNTNRIKGWRLDLGVGAVSSTPDALDPATPRLVRFELDNLALDGTGDLVGGVFYEPSWNSLLESDSVDAMYYRSATSKNQTQEILNATGTLEWNFTVEQTELWGGFVAYRFALPFPSYFNLSRAESLVFNYKINDPSSRCHFRFLLDDGSECLEDCTKPYSDDVEAYYSFHWFLDQEVGAAGTVALDLVGDGDWNSPWILTGWAGATHNSFLDKDMITGIRMEASIDVYGGIGTFDVGSLSLSNLRASPNTNAADKQLLEEQVTVETAVGFSYIREIENLYHVSYMNYHDCLRLCLADENCNYGYSRGASCFTATTLHPRNILFRLDPKTPQESANAATMAEESFWKTNAGGHFCEACECIPENKTIDCRGRDLAIVPYIFNESSWNATTLDLRQNPSLIFIGTGALDQVPHLEELLLPANLVYVSNVTMFGLEDLKTLSFEKELGHDTQSNIIPESGGAYHDSCCSRGETLSLEGVSGTTERYRFCSILNTVEAQSADAVLEPFQYYLFSQKVLDVFETSPFFFEAAESPSKCAAYCEIYKGCNYFTYNWRRSGSLCSLAAEVAEVQTQCCEAFHYVDAELTEPVVVSGRISRARYTDDNARVIVDHTDKLVADESNLYTVEFSVRLGSNPLRGSVTILPTLSTETSFDVPGVLEIVPERGVVLYDNETTAIIQVVIYDPYEVARQGGTVLIKNIIASCDHAFTSFLESDNDPVVIQVDVPDSSDTKVVLVTLLVGGFVVILALILVRLRIEYKRRMDDKIWTIKLPELKFDDPIKVLGHGTFGVVVLADYRGTPVAVKSALPPSTGNFSITGAGVLAGVSTTEGSDQSSAADSSLGRSTAYPSSAGSDLGTATTYGGLGRAEKSKSAWKKATKFFTDDMRYRESYGELVSAEDRRRYWERSLQFYSHSTASLRSDFVTEMRHLAKLRHPCITTCMGAVVEKGHDLLVMEYMDRGSLHDLLQNETVLFDGDQILTVLRDIVSGIRFLHACSPPVLHGDLKCSNILVDSKFRAKVADFGLSQKKRIGSSGTPYWMAPELLLGTSDNTVKSDTYSFGIILFEVYAREHPYKNEEFYSVLEGVVDPMVNKRPSPPDTCPEQVRELMAKCLRREPVERPSFESLDISMKSMSATMLSRIQRPFRVRPQRSLEEAFPANVVKVLQEGNTYEQEHFDMVSIAILSISDFDEITRVLASDEVSTLLERLTKEISDLAREHRVFEIEAVSPGYWIGVTNLAEVQPDHASRIVDFGVQAVASARSVDVDEEFPSLGKVSLRLGIHSGSCVAHVTTSPTLQYSLLGETVTLASRLESMSAQNGILCSQTTAHLLRQQNSKESLVLHNRRLVHGNVSFETLWVRNLCFVLPDQRPESAQGKSYVKPAEEMPKIQEGDEPPTSSDNV